jgi:hypothetical protein
MSVFFSAIAYREEVKVLISSLPIHFASVTTRPCLTTRSQNQPEWRTPTDGWS